MLGLRRGVAPAQLDLLWRLAARLDRHEVARLAGAPGQSAQQRVDHLHGALVAGASVQSLPSAGSWLTRRLVEQVTQGGLDAARTVLAATGVLALCDVAGVDDERRRHAVLVRALLGVSVPPGWTPPAAAASVDDRGRLRRLNDARRRFDAVGDLAPDSARLWQKGLAQLPLVGVVGAVLGTERSLAVVLGRGCAELGLPAPSGSPIADHLKEGARQVGHGVTAAGHGVLGAVRRLQQHREAGRS